MIIKNTEFQSNVFKTKKKIPPKIKENFEAVFLHCCDRYPKSKKGKEILLSVSFRMIGNLRGSGDSGSL